MIESIKLQNVGRFVNAELTDLKRVNYIFGANGTGKTVISQLIQRETSNDGLEKGFGADCRVNWLNGRKMDTLVYNRNFVEKQFAIEQLNDSVQIRGIYTFGENVEIAKEIDGLESEKTILEKKIENIENSIYGIKGSIEEIGIIKIMENETEKISKYIWNTKKKYDIFEKAFKGFGNTVSNFFKRYEHEFKNNKSSIRNFEYLRQKAKFIFSYTEETNTVIPQLDNGKVSEIENSPTLKEEIQGDDQSEIATLINKLNNSEWVFRGKEFFELLNNQCPFCQQNTSEKFGEELKKFFNLTFENKISEISELIGHYDEQVELVNSHITEIEDREIISNDDEFGNCASEIRRVLDRNRTTLENKKSAPGKKITMIDSSNAFEKMNNVINIHNSLLLNINEEKEIFVDEIMKYIVSETEDVYKKYVNAQKSNSRKLNGLKKSLEKNEKELRKINKRLDDLAKQVTSIKPTIEAINKILKSFNFTNFWLQEESEGSGFYKIVRPDGKNALTTLSEGEKSFITFLYFCHLIRGALESTGSVGERVVVFDDPVTSMDADTLFVVASLVQEIVKPRKTDEKIKQIFILSHNLYFFKEVSHLSKVNDGMSTFWTIKRKSEFSELMRSEKSPIKSNYDLLWEEVRKPGGTIAVQNCMRRILEYYFTFLGKKKLIDIPDEIVDKDEKVIFKSLISWVHDGSHNIEDEVDMSHDRERVETYKRVFRKIFREFGQEDHYKMMMHID